MNTVCQLNQCTGCMACVDSCPKNAISIVDNLKAYNAIMDDKKCINCGKCKKICQKNVESKLTEPISWYQGWCLDEELRRKSSSGGFAPAITNHFIKKGGIVYSCAFSEGEFIFCAAKTIKEASQFVGSKYVKSNPKNVYSSIEKDLKNGQEVLFIGLPCQVAALKLYINNNDLFQNLYTIDLICHGTPSPKTLEMFLSSYNKSLNNSTDVSFRIKEKRQLRLDGNGIKAKGVSDKYSLAFLSSLFCTENCYSCNYSSIKRSSDITLGDSWGTKLPREEQHKGISLALCQTLKGEALLKDADLYLTNVDLDTAISNNEQLKHPIRKTLKRDSFFNGLTKKNIRKRIFMQIPKKCIKQDIKQILIALKIVKF